MSSEKHALERLLWYAKQGLKPPTTVMSWEVRSIVSGYKSTPCETLEDAKLIAKWNFIHDYEIVNKVTGVVFESFQRFSGREIPKCPRCQEPVEHLNHAPEQEYRCSKCENPKNKKEPIKIFKVRCYANFVCTVVEEKVK